MVQLEGECLDMA